MSKLLRVISFNEYREWFETNFEFLHYRSPYHNPAWLSASSRGVGFELVFTGIYHGSDLETVIPAYLTKVGPFTLYGSPLRGTLTSSLGPVSLCEFPTSESIFDLLEDVNVFARKKLHVHYARYSLRNAPTGALPHPLPDWEKQSRGSYRLNLTPDVNALWDGLKSDCRRNIRKAQNSDIQIVPFKDPELYFELLDETYRRHGSSSWHQESFFQNVLNELIPKGILWAWGAKYQDQIIAACLFLHDDQELHFVSGASKPQFGSLPTSYLLHWTAIETGAQNGLKVYNSDASEVRSIDQFKESFRPNLEKRFTLIWSPEYVRIAQKVFLSGSTYIRKFKGYAKSVSVNISQQTLQKEKEL